MVEGKMGKNVWSCQRLELTCLPPRTSVRIRWLEKGPLFLLLLNMVPPSFNFNLIICLPDWFIVYGIRPLFEEPCKQASKQLWRLNKCGRLNWALILGIQSDFRAQSTLLIYSFPPSSSSPPGNICLSAAGITSLHACLDLVVGGKIVFIAAAVVVVVAARSL